MYRKFTCLSWGLKFLQMSEQIKSQTLSDTSGPTNSSSTGGQVHKVMICLRNQQCQVYLNLLSSLNRKGISSFTPTLHLVGTRARGQRETGASSTFVSLLF
jgi:hypothetical protein